MTTRLAPPIASLALAIALVGVTAGAYASPSRVERTSRASFIPALPQGCLSKDGGRPSAHVEPSIAIDPRDLTHVAVAWWTQQARRFGAKATGIAVSRNAGRTWRRSVQPGVDSCTGNATYHVSGAHDEWLAFGVHSRLYVVSQSGKDGGGDAGGDEALWVSSSGDDGRTWRGPSRPMQGNPSFGIPDMSRITADPRRHSTLYLMAQVSDPSRYAAGNTLTGKAYFTRSTDAGQTWSAPVLAYAPPGNGFRAPYFNRIHVLPNGDLVDVFDERNGSFTVPGPDLPALVQSIRSQDGGASWSLPTLIATHGPTGMTADPEDKGPGLSMDPATSSAMANDGTLYAAWEDPGDDSASNSTIHVARSTDAGATWTETAAPTKSNEAFQPTVAVAGDGTVGVTWYDTSADRPGDAAWAGEVEFAHSHDRGATWTRRRIAGPMDLRKAAPGVGDVGAGEESGAPLLGDYYGLAGLPHGFAAAYIVVPPLATTGPSEIAFARIGTSPHRATRRLRLHLTVHPKRVRAGVETRFGFVVRVRTNTGVHPVADALVRLAGKRRRTGPRGRAAITTALRGRATFRAFATKTGFRGASARIQVIRGGHGAAR